MEVGTMMMMVVSICCRLVSSHYSSCSKRNEQKNGSQILACMMIAECLKMIWTDFDYAQLEIERERVREIHYLGNFENWKAHDTKAPRDKKITRASTLEQMYMHGILHKLKTKQRNVFVCASFAVQWQWYQFFYAMNWIKQTARGFYYDNHKFYVPHPSELLGYLPNHHFNMQWNHINLLICLQKWRKSPEISITLNVNNCIRLKYSLD